MSRSGVVGARVVLLRTLGTTGCANPQTDFFPQDARFADAGCRAVANDRANDAGVTVEDMDVQREVFEASYASCIDWHRTH